MANLRLKSPFLVWSVLICPGSMAVPRPAGSLQAPSLHYWLRQERRRTRRLINALRDESADRAAHVTNPPALPLARPRSRGFNPVAQEFAPNSLRPYRHEPAVHPSIEFLEGFLASLENAEDAAAFLQADERMTPSTKAPPSTPWISEEDAAARIQQAWRRCGARGGVGTVVPAEPGQAAPDAAASGEVAAARPRRRGERRVRRRLTSHAGRAGAFALRRPRAVLQAVLQDARPDLWAGAAGAARVSGDGR